MSTTTLKIQGYTNQYIADTGTNSVSAADRLAAITEAVRQLYNDFEFDFSNRTLAVEYYSTINNYDITTDAPDITEPVDLRREKEDQVTAFTRKSPREIAVEIGSGNDVESSFAIEIKDLKHYLVINHSSTFTPITLHDCNSLTDNGTWAVDSTNSDATNLTADDIEKKEGTASLNFDLDVSQSGNNKGTIQNSTMSEIDLSGHEDLSAIILWAYLPDVTYTSSLTLYWGSSSTVYWSASATTDAFGASFTDGWNRVLVKWADASPTGSPDSSAIDYFRVDVNYTASQGDDTDYRIDNIVSIKPEDLTLYYQSNYVGKSSAGTYLTAFTATSDIPLYSGVYDYFDVYVAHRAAAILFRQMGQREEANDEDALAEKELTRLKTKFPTSRLTPTKNFKVKGLSWK